MLNHLLAEVTALNGNGDPLRDALRQLYLKQNNVTIDGKKVSNLRDFALAIQNADRSKFEEMRAAVEEVDQAVNFTGFALRQLLEVRGANYGQRFFHTDDAFFAQRRERVGHPSPARNVLDPDTFTYVADYDFLENLTDLLRLLNKG